MKRTCFLLAAGLMCQASLMAQTQPGVMAFQQLGSPAAARGGRGVAPNTVPIPRSETGKPFSAIAITQTSQTLSDGTHVSQTVTMLQYRDAEGRVRMEPREPGDSNVEPPKSVTIRDPVAGVTYWLDPARKTAEKDVMFGGAIVPAAGKIAVARGARGGGPGDISAAFQQGVEAGKRAVYAPKNNQNSLVEDLGMSTVNGVSASGTRITTVVPAGAIGNDREFRSVSERWFSPDLNLLIKSVNTDPRFGTTTYELTNISRQPPDPALFQPPFDYRIVSSNMQWREVSK